VKVNRFGMSQPLFIQMVKMWAVSQLMNAARMLVREGKTSECTKMIDEIEDVVKKTFLYEDSDVNDFLKTVADLRQRINLERAGQASASDRPS
jgi:hypothetical protein